MQETALEKITAAHNEAELVRGYVNTCQPDHIVHLANKLSAKRNDRALAQEALTIMEAAHTAAHPEQHVPPTAAMQRQAAVVSKLDAEVQAIRTELDVARQTWAPKYFKGLKEVTEPAIPRLERALADLQAALVLFEIGDEATRDLGLSSWYSPRGYRLGKLVDQLRSYTAFASGKNK